MRLDTPACPELLAPADSQTAKPHVAAEAIIAGMMAGMAMPKRVPKWWGHELHYRNDNLYCMKWLHMEHGGATSMHFHVAKHETLLVASGILTVETVYDKQSRYRRMGPGAALVVAPGFAHRLIAAEGPVDIIEASTMDHDDDSVRIA